MSSLPILRFGIVGLGSFGETYLACLTALRMIAGVEVSAVCSRSASRAQALATEYGVPRWYTDVSTLAADPSVDVVCVVTTEHEHCAPTLTALRAGKDAIVEKPLATTLADANQMIQEAELQKRRLLVAQTLRFDVLYRQVTERVRAGEMGEIVSIQTRRNRPAELTKRYRRTHPLLETGILDVDVMLWLSQSTVRRVRAFTRTVNPAPTPDLVWGILEFASGALGVLETNWLAPSNGGVATDDALTVTGRRGSARIDLSRAPVSFSTDAGYVVPDISYEARWGREPGGALREELLYFVRCLRDGRDADHVPLAEVRHGLAVTLALIRSATEDRDVSVSDVERG